MQLFLCKLDQYLNILSHFFLLFQECSFNKLPDDTALRAVLYIDWAGGLSNILCNHSLEGYCENLAGGTVSVERWVDKCSGYSTQGNPITG